DRYHRDEGNHGSLRPKRARSRRGGSLPQGDFFGYELGYDSSGNSGWATSSERRSACRIQQLPDSALDLVVLAFPGMAKDDGAVLVDDVLGRPVLIAPRVPGRRVIILRHRIGDAMPFQRGLYIAGRALERELRCVDADDDKTLVLVGFVQPRHMRQ